MPGPDIRDLAKEKLPAGQFPASKQTLYRVFFAPDVHAAIHGHAAENKEVEICGVVVGTWEQDADGPFARITHGIRCDQATQKFAEVTFTHDSWNHINQEMDTKFSDKRIIGWYHSHPDFGIFLSDRDDFIQQNFFGGPGQIALVVDPVRLLEGVFEWKDGKTELMPHYWVGDRLVTSSAATASVRHEIVPKVGAMTAAGTDSVPRYVERDVSWLSYASTVLAWVAMFLIGYLLNGWIDSTERQLISQGAVAHYGLWKVRMFGWEEALDEARGRMKTVTTEVKELADQHVEVAGDKAEETRKRWRTIREHLNNTQKTLDQIANRYSMSDAERQIFNRLLSEKLAALQGLQERSHLPSDAPQPDLPQLAPSKPAAGGKPKSAPVQGPALPPGHKP